MKLYLASKNKHKVNELQSILQGQNIDVHSCSELSPQIIWQETGTTFRENAQIKALAVRQYTSEPILADDSGLIVDALNGEPGVYSARYAGENATDQDNNVKLFRAMQGITNRKARFVCCLAYSKEGQDVQFFEGICEGVIAETPSGVGGFGYDSLFSIPSIGKTMAELTAAEKDQISHRAQAMQCFMRYLLQRQKKN